MTSFSFNFDPGRNRRTAVLAVLYAAVIAASFYASYEIRFDFFVGAEFQAQRLQLLPIVVGLKLVALIYARQLGSMMTYFSIPDLFRLVMAMVVSSVVLYVIWLVGGHAYAVPRGVLLVDFMTCTGALCAGRLGVRLFRERLNGHRRSTNSVVQQQRIAIIGAGDAGASLAKEFLTNPSRGFRPVAFFDDDTKKHGKLVHGVPVLGGPEMIDKAKGLDGLAKVVIAMPSASAKRTRQVVQLMTERGLKVETLPSLEDLAAGRVKANRIRPVEVQDLLGREAVDLDSAGIRASIEGRVVLVSGAGGSIGSELCRQIAAQAPKRLLLVEQSEGALFVIEQELNELGHGPLAVPLVGDILDEERMRYIFEHYRPEVVFHAAAHKHVFMMERQPAEAIRNNVLGTRQLAEIAAETGVDRFVLISTDKAINPTSVMGATKRLAELQLMDVAAKQGKKPHSISSFEKANADELTADTLKIGQHESPTGSHVLHADLLKIAQRIQRVQTNGHSTGYESVTGPASGTTTAVARTISQTAAKATPALPSTRSAEHSNGESAGSEPTNESIDTQIRRTSSHSRKTKFMAVRFGNVLGSSGSVIPIFKRQIANGGPVTVTHPEVTRYFMTIPEAVGLVLQTSILGQGEEIFVLDMGHPVKIVDLAKQMIELSGFKVGDDIEIKFTGLKPGEKLFEELQHHTEQYTATEHPRIMRFTPTAPLSESGVQELRQRLYDLDSNQLKAMIKRLVPEYTPHIE